MCIASSVTGEEHFRGSEAHAAASRMAGVIACICFTVMVRKGLSVSPRVLEWRVAFSCCVQTQAREKITKTRN
jgi:hypothetical protein